MTQEEIEARKERLGDITLNSKMPLVLTHWQEDTYTICIPYIQ